MASRRLLRRYLLAALPATLVASAVLGPARAETADPAEASTAPAESATATFSDTFDGPAGSAVDGAKWTLETGDNANNHERQYYTPGTENAALDGQGHLVITARKENPAGYQCWYGSCEYTSARLNTAGKFTARYGHVEARMKIPRGQGMWPAFWMLGTPVNWPDSGEVDVMENVGFEPSTVYGTIHGPGYSGSGGIGTGYSLPGGQAFADAFHTFAVDWAPGSMTWSVDGNVYQRHTSADLDGKTWVFDKPFFLILNLAVGGYWPGDPDGSTQFPQQLVVDSVSVTTSGGTTPTTGNTTPTTGSTTDTNGNTTDTNGNTTATTGNTTATTGNTTRSSGGTTGSTGSTAPSAGSTPSPSAGTTGLSRSATGSPIHGPAGKCVDVTGTDAANGTPVQLYDCNGTQAQTWTAGPDGTLRALGKCLAATGGGTADDSAVELWDCTGGADQKWTLTGAHEIVSRQANKCLGVTGGDAADGTRLRTGTCSRGADQKWTVG
ncbi:family 16 glycosylhydrolase [Streptomyces naphthomycinicus]|uniref:family 16 glycosylhydrolase n=1 Tax=Streptomyces naphthomycinicus TaxID=2872625 RepID=UPI001CEC07A0|nr:family 16 glycosylhydrolase [Streptomyces sp. TML10]